MIDGNMGHVDLVPTLLDLLRSNHDVSSTPANDQSVARTVVRFPDQSSIRGSAVTS